MNIDPTSLKRKGNKYMPERLSEINPKNNPFTLRRAEIENAADYIDTGYLVEELDKLEKEEKESHWWELEGKTDTKNLGC